jgi:hypothetical protein
MRPVRSCGYLIVGIAVALTFASSAYAQAVADPEYWKATPERAQTVYRLFYDEAPQTIPADYDPVAEAEQILRGREAALPASTPEATSIFKAAAEIPIEEGLAPRPGPLYQLALAATAFDVGWKIGSGINAKLLHLGLPGSPDTTALNPRLQFVQAGTVLHPNHVMPYDGWVWMFDVACCNGLNHWFEYTDPLTEECSQFVVEPPQGWGEIYRTVDSSSCWRGYFRDPATAPTNTLSLIGHENDVIGSAPIEDYNGQQYGVESPAPTPPPRTTVEQGIRDELAKPESELLTQWLNYHLGSPNETDPLGVGPPNSDIEFVDWYEHWKEHGHEFTPQYDDPEEYRRDATEIVERKRNGDPDILVCQRGGDDPADLYWDPERQAIVVVKDGKITTYFVPDEGFDYWLTQCD